MIYTCENTIDIGKPVDVYLDGVKQEGVIFADTIGGVIKKHSKNENGEWFIAGDEIKTEEIFGKVEVVPIDS